MRTKARKIGVLVTDGKSQDDIIANSERLREEGIELYAIGKLITCNMPINVKNRSSLYVDPFLRFLRFHLGQSSPMSQCSL